MAALTTYATPADLVTVGISAAALSDFVPNEQLDVIEKASRKVDSYLRSHYTLPLTKAGADVMEATVALSVYWLLSARGYNPEAGADVNVRDRYLDAIRWLEKVASGTVSPDVIDSSTAAVEGRPAGPRVISSSQRGWSARGSVGPVGPFVDD